MKTNNVFIIHTSVGMDNKNTKGVGNESYFIYCEYKRHDYMIE